MTVSDFRSAFSAIVVAPSTTGLTTTGTGTGVDSFLADGPFTFDINVGTVTGTTPVCTFKVQESSDNSTWTDVVGPNAGAALTSAVSAAGKVQIFCAVALKRYVTLAYTITGTNPVFPTSVVVWANDRLSAGSGLTAGGSSVSPQS